MSSFSIHTARIDVQMKTGIDIVNITEELKHIVRDSGIKNGTIDITVNGSTGSVTSIEYEPGVVQDLKRAITEIAPPEREYEHEKAWHDGNGHSHVQAAIMGPSVSLAIRSSNINLGTWQQIVLINHDNRSRKRTVDITIIGIC